MLPPRDPQLVGGLPAPAPAMPPPARRRARLRRGIERLVVTTLPRIEDAAVVRLARKED
jgi:hypothetical protein